MESGRRSSRHLTLGLTVCLHAFTHAYGTLLIPLYLLMRDDLGRSGVKSIALLVTLYSLVYCLCSYGAGMLADRFNRKNLLGIGLIGNAAAVALMGVTRRYELLVVLSMIGGAFGALFHPAANALVPAHYPKQVGMAIGMLAIGAGVGFFAGPQYAGWRADVVGSGRWGLAAWQVPCLEAGVFGVVFGLVFLLLAREAGHGSDEATERRSDGGRRRTRAMGAETRRRVLGIAGVLGWRDFAGIASISLVSIYLQKAHGYDTKQTGWIVGSMMLIGIVANPLAVVASHGRRRLPGLASALVVGGLMLMATPLVPLKWALPYLLGFQVFHLGSYAVSEAAMLERVDPAVRGRLIGLFITVAGTLASTSAWAMGLWTDLLGEGAFRVEGYRWPFGVLGAVMMVAAFSAKLIGGLGEEVQGAEAGEGAVLQAMDPTMEPVG